MANKHKGEVELQVGDSTYVMRLSVNALCNLESALDRPKDDIFADLASGKVRINTLRAITHAALVCQHPEVNLEVAGDIMAKAGMGLVVEKLTEAVTAAFPVEAKVADKNPK